jgi:hypothetical protein
MHGIWYWCYGDDGTHTAKCLHPSDEQHGKEKDYSWLRWMMQNNATTQLTLPWNIRLGQNLSFSLKDKMEEQKHLRLFAAKKPHEL